MFALELAYSVYQPASPPSNDPTGRDALGKWCLSCQWHLGFRGGGREDGVTCPKLRQFTHHPPLSPWDAVLGHGDVSGSAASLCTATGARHQAGIAPLATPKLPEGLLDFHCTSLRTGQSQHAQSLLLACQGRVPVPRAVSGWRLVTPAVASLCLARTLENLPPGSYCLFVLSKYQCDTLRNVGMVKQSTNKWHLSGMPQCSQVAQSSCQGCAAGLEEPSVLTSPWAGSSPAAAIWLFTRAAFGVRAMQEGELEKVLPQLSLWSRNRSRTREGVLFLIRRDTSSL